VLMLLYSTGDITGLSARLKPVDCRNKNVGTGRCGYWECWEGAVFTGFAKRALRPFLLSSWTFLLLAFLFLGF
jgi:hypothetical protein